MQFVIINISIAEADAAIKIYTLDYEDDKSDNAIVYFFYCKK